MIAKPGRIVAVAMTLAASIAAARTSEVARFDISEPLGVNWPGEWLTRDLPGIEGEVHVVAEAGGRTVPSQIVEEVGKRRVLFLAAVRARTNAVFTVVAGPGPRDWRPVTVDGLRVSNGLYSLEFPDRRPLPLIEGLPTESQWPAGAEVTGVRDQWLERGPARAVLSRTFAFRNPEHRHRIVFDCRAEDAWIGVEEHYAFDRGSFIRWDMAGLKADRVYHPHSFNARNSRVGGDQEDSTLEPDRHPIATLGPIWRDIWFGGGPFAFVYATNAAAGIGVAAVRGSRWDAPPDISLESQNLAVHGDREREGLVWVRLPADAGTRHWAIVPGRLELRKEIPGTIRRRVEIPLDVVLKEWILDWPSRSPPATHGMLGVYLGGCFNEHLKCPTTFPRRVKRQMPKGGPFKSRALAALAYIFENPDYWPGPKYRWKIGNPNFHTDMYPVPFLVGLLMPDHPHSRRWVEFGMENLKWQVENDSFPGGAWKESIGYSGAFFGVTGYLRMAREAGFGDGFRDWPRIREVLRWFACMETPVDPRYGTRQKAPLGDTSVGDYASHLNGVADDCREVDQLFSERLKRFPENWERALHIGSREFPGFGAMMRGNAYDERHESFVTVKAGPARNHYQGDELSFYFASLSTPLAIDYACHYSPRPNHAAMHNRPDMNGLLPLAIGVPRAFATNAVADVFVADERATRVSHVPILPHETTMPAWEYPVTGLPDGKPWLFRRYAMLVKHDPASSRLPDYLVVRDEIESPEPPWWNLHVLARGIRTEGGAFLFSGQLGVELAVHVLSPDIGEVERRRWGWGGTLADKRGKKGAAYEAACFGRVIPEDFTPGAWKGPDGHGGEQAEWLRLRAAAGRSEWLVVLMPRRRGTEAPRVERLDGSGARVSLGSETETVRVGTKGEHQASVIRNGDLTVLLPAGTVKPPGD